MNTIFHLYGLLIGIGIVVSVQISVWLANRRGYSPNIIRNGLWWVIIPAIIGARLYHILDLWSEFYSHNLINIFYLWNGGLAIFGALLGGFLGLYFYWLYKLPFTVYRLPFTRLLDLIAFSIPIGQVIGRLGNYFNKELYGLPSSLPWAIKIENNTYHPLFAYEAIWSLIGFSIMLLSEFRFCCHCEAPCLAGRQAIRRCGNLSFQCIRNNYFAFYLIWYGAGRFFLEFLRPNEFIWQINFFGTNMNVAEFLSLLMIIIGLKLMVWMKKN